MDPPERDQQAASDATLREREQLLAAVRRTVAEQGYRGATVEAVVRAARLPRRSFEAHFATVDDAILAAQADFFVRLHRQVERSCAADLAWPEQVRAALAVVLDTVTEAEALARVLLVEAPSASFAAAQRQFEALDGFAALLCDGRRHYPQAVSLPELTERTLVGGVASIVTEGLLAEDTPTLRGLESQLLELILTPYLGPESAHRASASDCPA
ncbi:MAG TPA: TetR/AcrR family transcriptional regulator [Solirubrobacterales bacterium]|nr:TetR/AcrR family transcriptional regulator [Solirubrobacterales bacterium]